MSAPNSNILALFHDGHYLAEIVGGGIRVGKQHGASSTPKRAAAASGVKLKNGDADWQTPCQNCEQVPTVHPVALCGPCCFGEAETAGGNW